MSSERDRDEQHPLADIDRVIHAPARLMVMTYLYIVESADHVFLARMTGLTWGNLSSHMGKLEDADYISIEKEFVGKKPHTFARLTPIGRSAFRRYREMMQRTLGDLPD
jgi:DNA-binding MarR family transcriptional regulator